MFLYALLTAEDGVAEDAVPLGDGRQPLTDGGETVGIITEADIAARLG